MNPDYTPMTERVVAHPWRVVALLFAAILSFAAFTGCLSTGGSAADGAVVSAPRTVADYAAEAHDIAYLSAGIYLASRLSGSMRPRAAR